MIYWNDPLFLCSGIIGTSLLIITLIMRAFVPKEINNFYGYRTRRSMVSQVAWNFAQLHSNRLMIWVAIFNILLGLIGLFIGFSVGVGISISMIGLFGSLIYLVWDTERELKERFSE